MNKPNRSEFYKNNPFLPRANLNRNWTQFELDEFEKCANDIVYFARKYFKIIYLDRGLGLVDLYDFQEEFISKFINHRNIISVQSRQSGKSTVATICILHYIIFNEQKTVAILANKAATSRQILKRIKTAFENLPNFLKPGVSEWNKSSVTLDNGCVIMAEASSSDNIRGQSINILLLDEMAFIPNFDDFASGVLPTISQGTTTKLMIISTPNGLNSFYEYVENAKTDPEWGLVEVPWWKVPGRDEEWAKRTLAQLKFDQRKFDQEYAIEFEGSSGTLISGAHLKLLKSIPPIHTHDDLTIYKDKKHNGIYAIIVDTSRGKGLDYSAFSVVDISGVPYEQVATYRSNDVTPQDYTQIIHQIAKRYNNAYVLIELNDGVGLVVSESLFWDYEYENILMTEGAGRAGKKISTGFGGANIDRGIYTSKTVKAVGCSMLKLLIEQKQLIIHDKETISELRSFSKKNNSYQAEEGKHDDLVMGLVLFGWLTTQDYFKQLSDTDVNQHLKELNNQDIEDYVNGLGIMAVNSHDYDHIHS